MSAITYSDNGWSLQTEQWRQGNSGPYNFVHYVWGSDLSGTLDGAGGVGGLLATEVGGAWYFPLYDNNGNVTDYVSETGEVVASYAYDAFGRTLSATGSMSSVFPFRFSTKYYDAETGLYYYGYRYYSPELGRWITRDPIEEDGGDNLYAFCGNNGISSFDKQGLFTVYVHTDGFGHVGVQNADGITFDYGRYHGKYISDRFHQSGPNILVKGQGLSTNHVYALFNFNVCDSIDEKLSEVLDEKFAAGLPYLPQEVKDRFDKKPSSLTENKRYMGSDWSINNNCMTFSFKVLANTVGKIAEDATVSPAAKKQAAAILYICLSGSCAQKPSTVKRVLNDASRKYDWIERK